MTRTRRAVPVYFGNVGNALISFRIVRDIRQWDGRTVGRVRNGYGAEVVVQKSAKGERWDALNGVYWSDIERQR